MSRFADFLLFFFMLWTSACSSKLKNNGDTATDLAHPKENKRSILLQFSKEEPITYFYEEDNPMEVVLWNNPIKPSKEVDLITTLPDNIKIPEKMAFVAGKSFGAYGQRIRGFFIDQYPSTNKEIEFFLEQSSYDFMSAVYKPSNESVMKKDNGLNLNWEIASAYCQWIGKRLPTKAEWTYAFSDRVSLLPYNTKLITKGKWEWLVDWYLPEYQNKHIFVPDAESKKMVIRKQQEQFPIYEWKPMAKQPRDLEITCRCVQDISNSN